MVVGYAVGAAIGLWLGSRPLVAVTDAAAASAAP
jgi:hypothetical protein